VIYDSIINRRTIRKFKQQEVPKEVLIKCVDAARLSPVGSNHQPLKYIIINDKTIIHQVYSTLHWAFDTPGPNSIPGYKHEPDEVPTVYIVILLDTNISQQPRGLEEGIAAMSISMVAYEEGVASCIMRAVEWPHLIKILKIPDIIRPLLVIALGYPAEKSKAVELKGDDTKYWYDDMGIINVPKRKFEDIVVLNTY
jgi:FMN reductase [NAD(P)H]